MSIVRANRYPQPPPVAEVLVSERCNHGEIIRRCALCRVAAEAAADQAVTPLTDTRSQSAAVVVDDEDQDPRSTPLVDLVSTGDEWSRLVRRTQAARRAARQRHPASGRAQPDRPGMIRVVPVQPDRQPPGPADAQAEETTMPDSHDDHDDHEDDQLQAEQTARHREIDALIAAARTDKRDRLTAELARTDDLLAYCDQTAGTSRMSAAAECRRILLDHRLARSRPRSPWSTPPTRNAPDCWPLPTNTTAASSMPLPPSWPTDD